MTGRVYFLAAGRYVKIGHTKSLRVRFETLKSGCPLVIAMLGSFPGTSEAEARIHRKFAHLRVRREWFRATDELMDFAADNSRPLAKKRRVTEINIYLPDALGRRVRKMKGLSVSLICRRALQRAIRRIEREEESERNGQEKRKTA